MEKNGKNKIKLTDKVTKENLNSPQFQKWVARILAVCFILILAVQFIGCMSFSTYASETDTITLKAGTYRFNDILNVTNEFITNAPVVGENNNEDGVYTTSLYSLQFSISLGGQTQSFLGIAFQSNYNALGYGFNGGILWAYNYVDNIWVGEIYDIPNEVLQTHTILEDTVVDTTFGTWYIANTNYNEVNAPSTLSMDIFGSIDKTQVLYTLNYDEGMTWREWCTSEYNTINAYITDVSALDDNNNTTIMYGDIVCLALPNYDETNGFYNQTAMASYFIKDTQFFSADTVISTSGGNYYYVDTIYHVVSNEYANAYDKGYLDGKTDGEQIGYNEGYENGYWEGYQEGEYIGESNANGSNFGQNLIGNTFNGILGALNSITIYQTPNGTPVTIMGIVWGVIGIAVFIWILKLFVGG